MAASPEPIVCSFCGAPHGEARRFLQGANGTICSACVIECLRLLGTRTERETTIHAMARIAFVVDETGKRLESKQPWAELGRQARDIARAIRGEAPHAPEPQDTPGIGQPRCSLCGRPSSQVLHLIAGAHAAICDGCLDLADEVLHEGGLWTASDGPVAELAPLLRQLAAELAAFPEAKGVVPQVLGLAAAMARAAGVGSEEAS